jgi:predicted MPP superfamily phosphohydrolase
VYSRATRGGKSASNPVYRRKTPPGWGPCVFAFDPGILLRTTLSVGTGFALGLTAYSSVMEETRSIATESLPFNLQNLGAGLDGFRIAQISDLHYGPYTGEREVRAAMEAVRAARPDLIVLTGDFVTATWIFHYGSRPVNKILPCAELLSELRAPYGVYAVLGNHDWGTDADTISSSLRCAGIRVLRNEAVAIERGNARFWLAGVDCATERAADLDRTLASIPRHEAVVLLAHEPDFADQAARYPVDVQLSGHSHGGQIVIPGVPGYLPPLGRKYPRGLYQVGNLRLYVNRGIGVSGAPIRYGAPPEVTVMGLGGVGC